MERIEINGVWYVRESSITNNDDFELDYEIEGFRSEQLHFETRKYCFEIERMYRDDDETFYDGLTVKFTDKRPEDRNDWIVEDWDNNGFLIGVLQNDREALESARESMDSDGIKELKYIVKQLIKRGWLKID